jgi:hypothetical protein
VVGAAGTADTADTAGAGADAGNGTAAADAGTGAGTEAAGGPGSPKPSQMLVTRCCAQPCGLHLVDTGTVQDASAGDCRNERDQSSTLGPEAANHQQLATCSDERDVGATVPAAVAAGLAPRAASQVQLLLHPETHLNLRHRCRSL